MPYVVKLPARFNKNFKRGATVKSRGFTAKPSTKRVRRIRRARQSKFIARRLGSGVQWHKTSYGGNITMSTGVVPRQYLEDVIRDIPKYRNDPTATARQANLQYARLRDRIYLKGFKLQYNAMSHDVSHWITFRVIVFRNSAWDEPIDTGGTNWMRAVTDGGILAPSTDGRHLSIQKFNTNMCRSRKDILLDRQMQLKPFVTDNASVMQKRSYWIPVNQLVEWEAKGDSASSDDLKFGRYWFLFMIGTNDGTASGEVNFYYNVDAVWSEN